MKKQNSWLQRASSVLTTRRFWWFIVGLLVVQAGWIALSGKYPLAFDEDFHLGIIKLYAHHISPFWSHQIEAADPFGAVARDPSYLYQYLMSFPYRFLTLFTHNQSVIIIIFRFINIAFFATGLALFRKLLLKLGISRALAHFCLLVFVLLPIVPLLAAQINYDNLLLPLVALALLQTLKVEAALSRDKRLDAKLLLQLLVLCLLTSLVKYAFLPVFVAIGGFLLVRYWHNRRSVRLASLVVSWKGLSRWLQIGLVAGLVVSGGLFVERFGINLVHYHTPLPDCSKVLSVESCSEYGPWIRDYNFEINKVANERNPLVYTGDWFYGMWLRTFFAVSGPYNDFETRGPLLLPSLSAIAFTVFGGVAFLLTAKRLFKRYEAPVIWLFLSVSAVYTGFLWLDEYRAWVRTGQPVAINGRYLIAIFPLVMALMAAGVSELTRRQPRWRPVLATLAVFCLVWGGGVFTFILRSNDGWYWNSGAVRSVNHDIQKVLGPITPGYRNPVQFL